MKRIKATLHRGDSVAVLGKNSPVAFATGDCVCQLTEVSEHLTQQVNIHLPTIPKQPDEYAVWIGHECVACKGDSTADLLILTINKTKSEVYTYIYDVKESFHGIDVISHYCHQAQESLVYTQALLKDAAASSIGEQFGVFICSYAAQRLRNEIASKTKELTRLKSSRHLGGIALKQAAVYVALQSQLDDAQRALAGKIKVKGNVYQLDMICYQKLPNTTTTVGYTSLPTPVVFDMDLVI